MALTGNPDATFGDRRITAVPFDQLDELVNFGLTVGDVSGRITDQGR